MNKYMFTHKAAAFHCCLAIALILSLIIGLVPFNTAIAAEQGAASKVSFGVISDTHVTATKEREKQRLAKAFQFFAGYNLDADVVVGDLTDGGSQSEYDTWKSIMDANKGNIKLIASMGNHEGNTADRFTAATGDLPNANYVINGYHFITLSPGSGTFNESTGKGGSQGGSNYTYVVDWLKTQLDAAVADDPQKPIFIFFHHPLRNTFYVSDEWYGTGLATGKDSTFQSVFSNYPQVVTFSGHIHSPNNHPESIWQDGGFTAVNTVTTSYFEMESGMVYGTIPPKANTAAQAMIIEAEGSKVTIKNYDLISDQYIPQTWVFDVSKPSEFPYTKAREAAAKAPVFPQNAAVRVSNISDTGATVDFDQAVMEPNNIGDIVHSYRYDFINKTSGKVDLSFKTWSEYYMIPMPATITQNAVSLIPGTEYEVRIYAIDAFRKTSESYIAATFKTTGKAPVDVDNLTFEDLLDPMPAADLLDVDFSNGEVKDISSEAHVFSTNTGAKIALDSELGKNTATFTGKTAEGYLTPWTTAQYSKINDGFTIESVFKVNPFTSSYVDFFGNMQSAGLGFELSHGSLPNKANLALWVHIGGYKVPMATDAIEIGKWYHAVGVYDGKVVSLYINGRLVASSPASGTITTPASPSRKYVIGGDIDSTGGVEAPFIGSISLCRMYSEPLSNIDIYRLANRELSSNDNKEPIIRLAAEAAASCKTGDEYSVPSFTAVDNSGVVVDTSLKVASPNGNDVILSPVSGSDLYSYTFEPDVPGLYKLTYTASDKAGNKAVVVYNIKVTRKVPLMPTGLVGSIGDGQVDLKWDANTEEDLAGYKLYTSIDGGLTWDNGMDVGNHTTSTVNGLTNGSTYTFAVTAYNTASVESEKSAPVTITLPSPIAPKQLKAELVYNESNQPVAVNLSWDCKQNPEIIPVYNVYAGYNADKMVKVAYTKDTLSCTLKLEDITIAIADLQKPKGKPVILIKVGNDEGYSNTAVIKL